MHACVWLGVDVMLVVMVQSVRILDEDMLKAADQLMQEPGLLGSFNFYFFDGPHETRDQYGTTNELHHDRRVVGLL